jgi:DNA-binding NarL/FixJ family response regulator
LTLTRKERKNETVTVHKLLIVDDYEPVRRFICSKLERDIRFQIIGQACDGLEAVQKAEELKPDLIVLDIGLPKLSGIEAARRLRELVPHAKILFLSQESSPDVVEETLRLGALGYVHKTRAGTELLPAVDTVLQGRQFVGSGLNGRERSERKDAHPTFRHEVQFYSDDAVFLESFTRFIADALKACNPALVFVTRSHGDSLLKRLRAEGVDVDTVIQQGTYISLDAADSLSTIMVDGLPDPVRFFESLSGLIKAASSAAKAEHPRVAFCGERVGLLWAEGKTDAAIRLEQFCNELAKTHEVDILCAYPFCDFRGEEDERAFKRICAEHSAVHSR